MLESRLSRIAAIDTVITTTELKRDFQISKGTDTKAREHVLVRITDEDGAQGFGEASPLQFFTGETATTTRFAIDEYLAPLTINQDPRTTSALHRLWNQHYPNYRAAKCALDVALHDLVARRAQLTVADLLGGVSSPRLPLYKAIGFGTPEETVEEGEFLWSLGLRSFKLKIGDTPQRDIANLRALRERFGDELEIILDGNGGYTAQKAVGVLRQAREYNVAYIEQPVPGDDIAGMAFVRAHGGVPVMADESLYSLRNAYDLIRADAVDLFGIKLIKTAGLTTARQIAALAQEFGVRCVVISPFDTDIGIAASAMFASTFAPETESQGLGTFFAVAEGETTSLKVEDGHLLVPNGIGLGVAVDTTLFH